MASFARATASSSPSNLRLINSDDLCETCAALIAAVDQGHNTSSLGVPQSGSNNNNNINININININNGEGNGNGNGNGDNGTNGPSTSTSQPPEISEISEPSSGVTARAVAPAPTPAPTTEDIVQLIMISEVRDAEEKVEREAANLDAARRAFEHERRGVLASMRNARAALRTATDGYWQNTHDLAEAMAAFRREKHEFETAKADFEREKAAVEEARQALNLEREALEAERQAAEAEVEEGGAATGEGGRKRKLWRRVAGWLGRR